jgi:hypothetical protein
MTKKSKKLKWERVDDSYDLKLVNPETMNTRITKKLLMTVEDIESWGRHFNQEASIEFNRWLRNLNTPLKEQAYARLSNWFLCDREFIRKTDLGVASGYFWDALFCTRPKKRLTDPKRDYKVLPEKFALWWPKQLKCQKDC